MRFHPAAAKFALVALLGLTVGIQPAPAADDASEKTLNVLLVTGGCCHDYDFQTKALQLALKERGVKANWTVINEGGNGTEAQIDLYNDPNWAKGADVVIHNECFANTDDSEYIRRITDAHRQGTPAVVIHCAMHTYRSATIDDWRELLGVTSRRHEHQGRYRINVVAADHPIMKDFPQGHTSAMDELYVIEETGDQTTVLATSVSEVDGKSHPVYWTNQFGKARVFGTTYGHSRETFEDPAFLGAVTRGIEWAAGRLAP